MLERVPSRMRAAVIAGPRHCEVITIQTPSPARQQVLIRVAGCGVCGSDLPAWEGRPRFSYPLPPGSPGHEGWGNVVAVGDDVRGWSVGDRVAFLSERAFAEYDVAKASSLVRIPTPLVDADVPAEALGCAMNIWRRSEVRPGDTVAVIGVGFLGALVVQLASMAGARVIAISNRVASLDLARRHGAWHTLELDDGDDAIVKRVEELTHGKLCDRSIELVGLQGPLDLATKLTRVRGRLVIAGFHQDGPRQVDMFQWNWRGLDVINAHEREPSAYVAGMSAALDRIATGLLSPALLYTHRIPLARAGEAFDLLRERPDGFVKALVHP